jgi:hypothetical protein
LNDEGEIKRLQVRAHGMLPGVAGICLFLLFFTMVNVYGALQNVYGTGFGKYGVLAICTLLAAGIFGLLRLLRWGWALVLAGCILLASGDMYFFSKRHVTFFLIRGLFELVFFLYLVRVEVRDRLH